MSNWRLSIVCGLIPRDARSPVLTLSDPESRKRVIIRFKELWALENFNRLVVPVQLLNLCETSLTVNWMVA